MSESIEWPRAVVQAHDARYVQARVVYTPDDLGVHIMDRMSGVEIGVYQLDGEPNVKTKGKNNKPELGASVAGRPFSIVADCNCPRRTRRIDRKF